MRSLGVLIVCLAAAAGATSASGQPRLHAVGTSTTFGGILESDGHDLAYSIDRTTARVIDGHLHLVARVRAPDTCGWTSLGAGQLLANCLTQSNDPYNGYSGAIYDLASTATARLPAAPGPSYADRTFWTDLGRSWLQSEYDGYHYQVTQYVSRTTGEVRTTDTFDRSPRVIADLDEPNLWRTMCRPLHAGTADVLTTTDTKGRAPYVYAPPYGAGLAQHVSSSRGAVGRDRIIFGRCGQRQRTLAHCRVVCTPPIIANNAIAWTDGRALVAYLIPRRTFWRWPHALRNTNTGAKGPVAVGNRLFITNGSHDYTKRNTTLYTVGLPR